jgi:molybdopterin/thiamine biosynthesis adenylyltransferase
MDRDPQGLADGIEAVAQKEPHPSGTEYRVLPETQARTLSAQFNCSQRQVYLAAMERSIIPKRYLRNLESLSIAEQLCLARSRVALIGAGGLGGQAILTLARLGIGEMVVLDPDVFEESNLNRQALCTVSQLGRSKARVAAETVQAVNPGVDLKAHQMRFDSLTGPDLLAGVQVVVDCLDSVEDRLALEKTARELGIPLVHAAIDGLLAQMMSIYPEDPGLVQLYGPEPKTPLSPLGNPVFAPAVVSVLQALEVMKILLGRGTIIRNSLLSLELESCRLEHFKFSA